MASYQIARALTERHHQVDVLTTRWRDLPGEETVDGLGVYRVRVPGRGDLSTASLPSMLAFLPCGVARGSQILRKNHYDVLNTHFAIPSGPTGLVLSRLFKTPLVLTIIGGDIHDPSKRLSPSRNVVLRGVVRNVLNSSSQIIAISEDVKRRAREDLQCRTDIEVVHYGLATPRFEEKSRSELGIPEDQLVLIAVGRLIKRKALDNLLMALSGLEYHEWRLLVIGDGPEEQRLRDLAGGLGLSSRVEFLGAVWGERKFQYLAAADIFVLPSIHEGFGLVFLEAMYCGLPVLTSSTGGQTDFLKDGETGFLVPVGDVDALADRILRLARDADLRERMSRFNKEYVKRFDISGVAERYESLFSEVIQGDRQTGSGTNPAPPDPAEEGTHGYPHDVE